MIHSLPRRKRHPCKVQQIDKNTCVSPFLEDLVIESLQNIEEEWNTLTPSPVEEILTLFPGDSNESPQNTPLGSPNV